MKERNFSLDVLRIVACMMVVLMHSPDADTGLDGISYHCLDMLAEPCIGLFFMVSGFLLLPVKLSYFEFVKRRLNKVVWPTVCFSVLVLLLALVYGEISLNAFTKHIFSIPFATFKSGVLWFMYPLIGMYLLAPVISPFLESTEKKEIQFLLFLWLVTLCWNPLKLVLNVETTEESMLHAFSGYTGYFVLGYYLKRFPIRLNFYMIVILLIIPWCMDASNKIFHWGVSKYDYFWNLSVFCVMQCLAWYQIITYNCPSQPQISKKAKELIRSFSSCSFGIYLIHRIVIQRLLWNIESLHIVHPYLQVLIIFCSAILLSWGITEMLSRLPFANYIVGFKRK